MAFFSRLMFTIGFFLMPFLEGVISRITFREFMKFSESLKKNQQFRTVYEKGISTANRYFVLYKLENGLKRNRLGISVSKKVGNSVVRHHLARLIRENYRLSEELYKEGYDMVVVARVAAKNADYYRVGKSLKFLSEKLGLLKEKESDETLTY